MAPPRSIAFVPVQQIGSLLGCSRRDPNDFGLIVTVQNEYPDTPQLPQDKDAIELLKQYVRGSVVPWQPVSRRDLPEFSMHPNDFEYLRSSAIKSRGLSTIVSQLACTYGLDISIHIREGIVQESLQRDLDTIAPLVRAAAPFCRYFGLRIFDDAHSLRAARNFRELELHLPKDMPNLSVLEVSAPHMNSASVEALCALAATAEYAVVHSTENAPFEAAEGTDISEKFWMYNDRVRNMRVVITYVDAQRALARQVRQSPKMTLSSAATDVGATPVRIEETVEEAPEYVIPASCHGSEMMPASAVATRRRRQQQLRNNKLLRGGDAISTIYARGFFS